MQRDTFHRPGQKPVEKSLQVIVVRKKLRVRSAAAANVHDNPNQQMLRLAAGYFLNPRGNFIFPNSDVLWFQIPDRYALVGARRDVDGRCFCLCWCWRKRRALGRIGLRVNVSAAQKHKKDCGSE